MNLAKVLIATKLKTYENFQVDIKIREKTTRHRKETRRKTKHQESRMKTSKTHNRRDRDYATQFFLGGIHGKRSSAMSHADLHFLRKPGKKWHEENTTCKVCKHACFTSNAWGSRGKRFLESSSRAHIRVCFYFQSLMLSGFFCVRAADKKRAARPAALNRRAAGVAFSSSA